MGLSQILSATIGGAVIHFFNDITIVFLLSGLLSLAVNVVVVGFGYSSMADGTMAGAESEDVAEKEEEEIRAAGLEAAAEATMQGRVELAAIEAQQKEEEERARRLKEKAERQRMIELEERRERKERDRLLRQMLGKGEKVDEEREKAASRKQQQHREGDDHAYQALDQLPPEEQKRIHEKQERKEERRRLRKIQPPPPLLVPCAAAQAQGLMCEFG